MRASGELMCLYKFSTKLLPTMLSPVAKKATNLRMRCCSAGFMRVRRSVTSVEKSTSSTVHVFLIAVLNISKKTGYFIGRSVRLKPGFKIITLSSLAYWHASQDSGFSREQETARAAALLGAITVDVAIADAGRDR